MEFTTRLLEVRLEEGSLAGRIERPAGLRILPGQYLLGWSGGWDEPLTAALFPADVETGAVNLCPPLPQSWAAGMLLHLRGPLGQGFHLPAFARRAAFASLGLAPEVMRQAPEVMGQASEELGQDSEQLGLAGGLSRLRLLLTLALQQGAAVSVYADCPLPLLPAEVEIQPLDELPSSLAWADYLALDLPLAALPALRDRLGLKPGEPCSCAAEALVRTAMPCGGASACGACAVLTKSGWKLGCKDGPVFPLNELLG